MEYLGAQIVRQMQRAGFPCKIFVCMRSAEDQQRAFDAGHSKARPFQSPHQYAEACDLIHTTRAWNVSNDYWDALNHATRAVGRQFGITFETGYDWGWDKAHVELPDWRDVRDRIGPRHPTQAELDARFAEVLPKVWNRWSKTPAGRKALIGT